MSVIGHLGSAYKNVSGTQVKNIYIVTITYIVTIAIDVITKEM